MARHITRRGFLGAAIACSSALAARAGTRVCAAGSDAEALPGLDDYCRAAIADWQVPGMALAVVRDGKLLVARGYGVRRLGNNAPVDEKTIFPIASCTKSFTAAIIGQLVDRQALRWDDPLGRHVPSLLAAGRDLSMAPTISQALRHRTGLPAANMLWRSGQFTADEILRRLRHLKPLAAPDERFIYNNVMYLAAGRAAEAVSGRSWSELLRAEFFEPLGMKSSLADSSQLNESGNLAAPHATIDGQVKPIERYCPDVIAPTGAIHSTAADMAQWLHLHLGRGQFGGRELLSAAVIDELHTPAAAAPAESRAKTPQAPIGRYAMGWFVNEHAGRTVVEHSGTQNGFVAWMAMMPEERLGVVVLANHHQTGVNSALRSWLFDRLLERPDYDWSRAMRSDYSQGWQKLLREAKADFDAQRPPEEPVLGPIAQYAGTYESQLYGTMRVSKEAGKLKLRFGTRFLGDLQPWHGDTFRAFFSNPRLDDWLVTFARTDGKVTSLCAEESPWAPEWYDDRDDLGVFERV